MAGYRPLYIAGMKTGLVQERQEFLLPDDAYPELENAYVWRERIKRKQGYRTLGRLRRVLMALSLGNTLALQTVYTFPDIFAAFVPPIGAGEPNKEIEPGSLVITIGAPDTATFTDNGDGTFTVTGAGVSAGSSINYVTGAVTIVLSAAVGGAAITANINYFPGLPVMGLRNEQLNGINNNRLIAFDTVYAYRFVTNGWQEFIPGTVWTGQDFEFFWSTNYWVDQNGLNIFWVTNDSISGDPIRYTNGAVWEDFTPQINAAGDLLEQALCIAPFRGRLVVFNTLENGMQFQQRIRWAAIGTPFTTATAIISVAGINMDAWRDDIRGQGGFLDIPTADFIVSIGFVRDNLVVYCENSTWQLRYTGRAIAPFQIEKVNSELGAKSTFSAVQFDTSLVGVGDKGVVECDSFKSERIDIKIPDLIFQFNDANHGTERVHGIRDFQQRLAYWTYPYFPGAGVSNTFPNRRLVYNYENDSWAIYTDSLTCLGTFQSEISQSWSTATFPWSQANFPWVNIPALFPEIVGGNQQGFVLFLSSNLSPKVSNDPSLSITNITGNDTTPTVVESPNHNMQTGQVISISGIPVGTPFADTLNNPKTGLITNATQTDPCVITSANHRLLSGDIITIENVVGMVELNGNTYTVTVIDANTFSLDGVDAEDFSAYISDGDWSNINAFGIVVIDADNFELLNYNPVTFIFDRPQLDPSTNVYVGGGKISLRDGFSIVSKKFNFIEEGNQIQMGYADVLMNNTQSGAVSLYIYLNYNDSEPINIESENDNPSTNQPDLFFNSVVPTNFTSSSQTIEGSKNWQRVICPTRGQFLTLEWTLSNAQLAGIEQESDVQIDSQILWIRPAGRLI